MQPSKKTSRQGSALLTVVMLIAMMALLTGSMLNYTLSERRGNERNRLILRSKNMAENVALYSAEQISIKLHRMKSVSLMKFTSGANTLYLPPSNVLTTSFSSASDVETYAGVTSNTGLALITDSTNANYGLQVLTGTVPIIAKSRMTHPALGSITTYAEQDLQISEVPLFQFAIFYNKDLEFSPGADMVISGPVHSNGDFIARDQTGFSNTVQFTDRVTAVGGFFANSAYKATTYNEYDNADTGPGGTGPLRFQNPSGTVTDIQSSGGVWRDHKYGGTSVTTTSVANFKTFATNSYAGNFRTSAHQVGSLDLPGLDDTSANSGRSTIERPDNTNDSADLILAGTQFSRKAGLILLVNPTAQVRNGYLPYESAHSPATDCTVSLRAYSYRAFLNTINSDQSHTIREVILPGQPSYGALNANINNLPNAYRADTSVGRNQVLRIPMGGGVDLADSGYASTGLVAITGTTSTFPDAYFYDLRRSTNSNGHPFARTSSAFTPRPISKIDFDMIRFKMMVDRTYSAATTSTVFYPARPSDATTWSHSIFNDSTGTPPTETSYGLGLGNSYNLFGSQVTLPAIHRTQAGVYFPASVVLGSTTQTGVGGLAAGYAGRYIIAESSSATLAAATWTDVYTSGADETSYTYTPGAGITFARVRLYQGGAAPTSADNGSATATTRLLDEQIIPVLADTGTTVTAALTQDFMLVPSVAAGASPLVTGMVNTATTEMRVYIGGVDDTANWTFTAVTSSSSITGRLGGAAADTGTATNTGVGPTANRYTLATMTVDTGTVTITAARSGYASQSKIFTLKKESYYTLAGITQIARWVSLTSLPGGDPFQLYYAPSDPADPLIQTLPSTFAVPASDLYNTATGGGAWFDGITVYVYSADAEVVTSTAGVRDRADSAVRLWNGRGHAASLTASGTTGFSFCTNDTVYIVGHFNADGTIDSSSTDTGTGSPNYYGGYSARYPDSSGEYLTSVMGDSLTIYSQPCFTVSGSNYYQYKGWSDSLSANRCRNTNWSSSWMTTNPGSGNSVDGTDASITPALMPNLGNIGTAAPGATAVDVKLDPAVTEISACLLAGIVESNSHQNSGGVHNFPRLNENWSGTGLYIRGSMIAMFASEIETEPWSIRIYSGAGRYWGLHQNLRNANHDVPLEPMLISASRLAYKELTATDYASMKTTILALP